MIVGCENVSVVRLFGSGKPWASALTTPTAAIAAKAPTAARPTTAKTTATRRTWPSGVRGGRFRATARLARSARERGDSDVTMGRGGSRRDGEVTRESGSVLDATRLDERSEEPQMLDLALAPTAARVSAA